MVVLLSTFTFPLTITGASVALTDIADDLDAGLAATQWVVNGYNACFASFLVFAGSLADVLGRRRIYVAGLTLFAGGGIACTVAGNIVVLDLVRLVAGTGAAAAVTGGLAILTETFHGAARTRAFGLVGTVLGIGLAFGPSIGGLLVDLLGWRAVFGAPAAVAGLVLALTPLLPDVRGTTGRRIDWAGAALFTGAIGLLIFGLVEAGELGFGHPLVMGALVLTVVFAAAFPFVERRRADPLFDLALLANRGFTSLAVAAGALVTILVPLLVYLPSYLIEVVGLGAGEAGVAADAHRADRPVPGRGGRAGAAAAVVVVRRRRGRRERGGRLSADDHERVVGGALVARPARSGRGGHRIDDGFAGRFGNRFRRPGTFRNGGRNVHHRTIGDGNDRDRGCRCRSRVDYRREALR